MSKVGGLAKIDKIKNIVITGELNLTELKVFFILLDEEMTQSMIAKNSDIPLISVKRAAKTLLERNFIVESKNDGKNKYLTSNIDVEIINRNQIKLKI